MICETGDLYLLESQSMLLRKYLSQINLSENNFILNLRNYFH